MRRSFSYTLLITCFLLVCSCKTQYTLSSVEYRNNVASDSLSGVDSQLFGLLLPYKQIIDKDMSRVIAVSAEEMVKNKPESNLTNFLGDLFLEQGEKVLKNFGRYIKPDISYFNYGGIRTSLPKGEITVGKIFEMMPFENELVFIQVSGTQVREFLDAIAQGGGDSLGGVRFKISNKKAKDIEIGGSPLQPDSFYWMVTNDYVAAGGDNREMLTHPKEYIDSGEKVRDVIIEYLETKYQSGEEIVKAKDGRITYE